MQALTDTSHVTMYGAAEVLRCSRHRVLAFAAVANRVYFERHEVEALASGLTPVKQSKARSRW